MDEVEDTFDRLIRRFDRIERTLERLTAEMIELHRRVVLYTYIEIGVLIVGFTAVHVAMRA